MHSSFWEEAEMRKEEEEEMKEMRKREEDGYRQKARGR